MFPALYKVLALLADMGQASKASAPSRKRGRAPIVSHPPSETATEPRSADDENPRLRKRGRRATGEKTAASVITEDGPAAETCPPAQQSKGSRAKEQNKTRLRTGATGGQEGTPVRRSNRDRRAVNEQPWWNKRSSPRPAGRQQEAPKSAGETMKRNPRTEPVERDTTGSPAGDARSASVRRSQRDRRSADDNPWWTSNVSPGSRNERRMENRDESGQVVKKRGRPPASTEYSSGAQGNAESSGTRKRGKERPGRASLSSNEQLRGRARSQRTSNVSAEARTNQVDGARVSGTPARNGGSAQATRQGRVAEPKRGGRRQTAISLAQANLPAQNQQETRRRLDEAIDRPDENSVPWYRQVLPRIRQIPQSVIESKWVPLDDASISTVDALVANMYRPVLLRLHDRDQRYNQAHKILQVVASRVSSRLRKGMPFPPPSKAGAAVGGGHVEEFDFERTLDAIRSLETGLSPLSHSIALLRSERDKEEAALEREFDALRRLEANARSEAHSWREREKRLHVLTTEGTILDPEEDGPSGKLALVKAMDRPNGSVFKVCPSDPFMVHTRGLCMG